MPTFSSKPLRRPPSALSRLAPKIRQRPVLFFGLPFLITIVGASFGLSTLTQTRYDYNAKKVQAISKEDELRMKKNRRRVDIREEYFKLQAKSDELEEWEPKRIARPEGVAEWGVPPPCATSSRGTIHTEALSPSAAATERQEMNDASIRPSSKHTNVVLGSDGKPCRVCNSKLAFSAALKKAKPSTSLEKAQDGKDTSAAIGAGSAIAGAAAAAAAAATTLDPSSSNPPPSACPPDGPELGRSTWTFLHSTAAYFPTSPSSIQQSSMLALLTSLPHIYPCHTCGEALAQEYKREEKHGGWEEKNLKLKQAVKSGPLLRKWLCGIHNEVNQRLGKEKFSCDERSLDERWEQGPQDGRCD